VHPKAGPSGPNPGSHSRHHTGVHFIFGQKVLIVVQAFTKDGKKSPEFVVQEDAGWQKILEHKNILERVIIFLGKYESGTREIILRAAEDFADKKEVLFFILCPHELKEKRVLLRGLGFSESQWTEFKDNKHPCEESPQLLGYAIDFLVTHSSI
jgi:hypothetical protein